MLTFDLTKAEGFEVIHTSIVGNSVWRTAIHAWKEGVNDLTSFQNWGVHEDSEEAFVVLEGGGFLFTSKEGKEDEDYQCCALEMGSQYLVEKGELHAILLTEGSRVLVDRKRRYEPFPQRSHGRTRDSGGKEKTAGAVKSGTTIHESQLLRAFGTPTAAAVFVIRAIALLTHTAWPV